MEDDELEALAKKYNIITLSSATDPDKDPAADFYFDRPRVIESLVARDSAIWSGRAVLLSILALLVSLAALILPLVVK
jgi:hypothetical protein